MLSHIPLMDPSDDALLDRARAGDGSALEELLLRHQDQVYRFGVQLCRDPEDARDVLQDTLLSMARSVRDFRGNSSLSTWLYAIARSYCIKKHRRSKYAPKLEESLESDGSFAASALRDPAKDPDQSLAGKEIAVALERAIRDLEPSQREVLLLRDAEGLTAVEVSEVLGLSVAAVKSRLHRARLRVRESLVPFLGVDASAAATSTCPDILSAYSQHLEGDISSDLCAEMERHIGACGRCRGACDSLKQTLALCRTTPGAPVPKDVRDSVKAALGEYLQHGGDRGSAVERSRDGDSR